MMYGRELYQAIYEGEIPDRLPIEGLAPWTETLDRWYSEGLESGQNPDVVLGLVNDEIMGLPLDLNMIPRYPIQLLEQDDRYVTLVDEFGVKKKVFQKDFQATQGKMMSAGLASSMSYWLDFPVKDRQSWKQIFEERFCPILADRVPDDWGTLSSEFRRLSEIRWVTYFCFPLFGFFGPLRQLMGAERLLFAMAKDDPELIDSMVEDLTSFWLAVFGQMLSSVRLDEVTFFEDMASSQAPLIGPAMFKRFFAAGYKRIIGGLKDMGVKYFSIDSDGNIRKLIPDLIACGITGISPLEVRASMDVAELRVEFPSLVLHGGIDKRALASGSREIDLELNRYFGVAWQKGLCIPRLDHGAPPDISWQNAIYFSERYLELSRNHPVSTFIQKPWEGFIRERF